MDELTKALQIPFILMSASDPSMKCRNFVNANLQSPPKHWFKSMKDQLANRGCAEHVGSTFCQACSAQADLAVIGSPCHPYSTQRANRYDGKSVENHPEYSVSMEDTINFIHLYEPKLVVSEQVEGFDKPVTAGGEITPCQLSLI